MEDEIVIAQYLDCTFESINNSLSDYFSIYDGHSLFFRSTPASNEKINRLYFVKRDNAIFSQRYKPNPPTESQIQEHIMRYSDYLVEDTRIAAVEIIKKEFENIFLMRCKKRSDKKYILSFYDDLLVNFFPTKKSSCMVDQKVVEDLDIKNEVKIKQLFDRNLPYRDIASAFGISESTVKRKLQKLGLSRRK